MDQNQLLSATAELALDLLEKNGSFIPFCKAVNDSGETFNYVGATASNTSMTADAAYKGILSNVTKDIPSRNLKGIAFCFDSRVKMSDSEERTAAIEVEMHYRGLPAKIWYFPYSLLDGKATVLEYYSNDAQHNLFD